MHKEAKWGRFRDAAVQRLQSLESEGWAVVYTDGSFKTVREWMRGDYGVWFAIGLERNYCAHVSESERQSVCRGELRGVLHAILHRRPGESMAVVMDSEYVFKGITGWSLKWRRHGQRTSNGEVGHRDLWEQILWERERAGGFIGCLHIWGCKAIMRQLHWLSRVDRCTCIICSHCPSDLGRKCFGNIWGWRRCRVKCRSQSESPRAGATERQ